jgi:hypothetical protein
MRESEGKKKASQALIAERLAGIHQAWVQYANDPVIRATYIALAMKNGYFQPEGTFAGNVSMGYTQHGLKFRTVAWIPFPNEVFDCCRKISPSHAMKHGGYLRHCRGMKHLAAKHGISYSLLCQTVHYYIELKGLHEAMAEAYPVYYQAGERIDG